MKLRMAVDPGSSMTKISYQIEDRPSQILWMPSEVKRMSLGTINNTFNPGGNLSRNAWVRIQEEDKPVAVGFLAKNNFGMARMDLPKYQQAVYKILAAVGAIVGQSKRRSVKLDLGVMLPYSETANQRDLEFVLTNSLKHFYFQDKKISVKVSDFECVPEGFGLLMLAEKKRGEKWLNNSEIAVLMFGHRNTSCLTFKNGTLAKANSATSEIGFARFIDTVIERRPGLKPDSLGQKLTELALIGLNQYRGQLPELSPKLFQIKFLAQEAGYKSVKDYHLITNAIAEAKEDHWESLSEWLDTVVSSGVSQVIVAGGSSLFFRDKIFNKYRKIGRDKIIWLTNWAEIATKTIDGFTGSDLERMALAYRFLDVVGYWQDLTATIVLKEAS